jgi:hypothetical protein
MSARARRYRPATADAILEAMVHSLSLRKACKAAGIDPGDWYNWIDQHPELAARYARAREIRADLIAEEVLEIADDESLDPQSRRVRFDARRWYLGKLHPRSYGDKVMLAGDRENPLVVKHPIPDFSMLTKEERALLKQISDRWWAEEQAKKQLEQRTIEGESHETEGDRF